MTFRQSYGQYFLLRIGRCKSDKAHFHQIIKSKARMDRRTLFSVKLSFVAVFLASLFKPGVDLHRRM